MNLKYILTITGVFFLFSGGYAQTLDFSEINSFPLSGKLSFINKSGIKNSRSAGIRIKDKNNLSEDSENELSASLTAGYMKETEENFTTASIYQNYKLSKKFSDKFSLSLNSRIENAERESNDGEKIKKWFDNTYIKPEYSFNPYNILSLFAGGSISDSVITTYGITYKTVIENDKYEIRNFLTVSYDYFYYWNQIGQNYVNDNIEFRYKDLKILTGFYYGVVDFNFIEDYNYKAKNPNTLFSVEVQYKLLNDPVLNAGVAFSTRDFKYHSPLYYSPSGRTLTGAFANLYKPAGKFYLYLSGGARLDNENVFIWDTDTEFGYDNNGFSASIGFGRFDDPYYSNFNAFLNLSKIF